MLHTALSVLGELAWQGPPVPGPQFPHLHNEGLGADCLGSPPSCWQSGGPDLGQEPRGAGSPGGAAPAGVCDYTRTRAFTA